METFCLIPLADRLILMGGTPDVSQQHALCVAQERGRKYQPSVLLVTSQHL
jgi:hypothetical protein